jgi:MHS family proline/betaine transporter-like MFS transporter
MDETPAFREAQAERPAAAEHRPAGTSPVALAGRAFGFTMLWTISYYIFLNYMPSFTARYASLTASQALWSNTLGLVVLVGAIPFWGWVSDRVGRRPVLLACCLAFLVVPWPVATWLASGPSFRTVVALQVALAVVIAMFSGTGPAAIAEIFPTRQRSTWMTTGYALAVALFGGFAPFLATWLIRVTGSPVAWVWYVMVAAAVTGTVIWRLEETAHRPLA